MSSSVFPTLTGLAWDVAKTPAFSTEVQQAVSGAESRIGLRAYPLYQFDMKYEFLGNSHAMAGNELKKLLGLFLKMRGSLDTFLYTDTSDYSVIDQNFGTGDGSDTTFQLIRTYGDTFTFDEPIYNVNALTNIKVNGVTKTLTTDYTVSSTGLVTFVTPPALGHAITWTGTFYYRCRFLKDEASFSQFMRDLWELRQLQMLGSTMNKV